MKKTLVATMATLLAACASTSNPYEVTPEKQLVLGKQPDDMVGLANTLYTEGEWAAVLNYNRLAVAALEHSRPTIASAALDQSIARIESVYADDPTAKKARGLWSAEGIKDFKGEPYERAMTYYYRGVLYMADGDYQNARASFKAAEYQDTVAEKEEFSGDFGMMMMLAGWSSHCDGNESAATDYYDQADKEQPGFPRPSAQANTLVLIETGASPVKSTSGQYQEALVISAGADVLPAPRIVDDSPALLVGDVGFQATTRGGRQVDKVLAGKASFKDTTKKIGDTATAVGFGLLQASTFTDSTKQMQDLAGLGLASSLFGLASSITSSVTTPKADSRYWDTLPNKVYAAFVASSDNATPGVMVDGVSARPALDAKAGACRVMLIRSGTNSAPSATAPGNIDAAERADIFRRNSARDVKFRQELTSVLQASATTTAGL